MKKRIKKHRKNILSLTLLVVILAIVVTCLVIRPRGSERFFSGAAEEYYQGLLAQGFPEDYAVSLTELHLLHPTWTFTPLMITEAKPTYTWDYVIGKEIEKGDLNVVYSSATYAAYHHPTNKELYDKGYYQASRQTVEYFMDPRNFLNETDIFQFYALAGGTGVSLASIDAVLAGTFMEDAVLENGRTYAEYFLELGALTDVNPIFLAAKVRNEQGTQGTSPIISGSCGDVLWNFYENGTQKTESGNEVNTPSEGYDEDGLRALNGYYNHFNVGATGKGIFEIYYNAMQRAIKGTPDLTEQFGGNASWNARWKALYGGAYFLQTRYVGNYQSTVYLQKFNVDSRAEDNFRYQYMTSVQGAMSEGRTLYQSFAALDLLDAPANFLIPVYGKMPASACKDPAGGLIKNFSVATNRYAYSVNLSSPDRYRNLDHAVYLETDVYPNSEIKLVGSATHDYQIEEIQYAWDFGAWQTASTDQSFNLSITNDFSVNSSHILTVRGKATYQTSSKGSDQTIHTTFLAAVIYVNVVPVPQAELAIDVNGKVSRLVYDVGTEVSLPLCNDVDFAGWHGSDNSFLPSGANLTLTEDLTYSAVYLDFKALSGATLRKAEKPSLRFSAVMDPADYEWLNNEGKELVSLSASVTRGSHTEISPLQVGSITNRDGRMWTMLSVCTDGIDAADYTAFHAAEFYAILHYTDGTTGKLVSAVPSDARSPRQVAEAALADTTTVYSAEMHSFLQKIAEAT